MTPVDEYVPDAPMDPFVDELGVGPGATVPPEVLTSARSGAERSGQRTGRETALIAGAVMIGLFGFGVLAGPGGTEIGVLSRYSPPVSAAPVVIPEAGTLGGYAPNLPPIAATSP